MYTHKKVATPMSLSRANERENENLLSHFQKHILLEKRWGVHEACAVFKASDMPSIYWKQLWSESIVFDSTILPNRDVGSVARITTYREPAADILVGAFREFWQTCGGAGTVVDEYDDSASDCLRMIWYRIPGI